MATLLLNVIWCRLETVSLMNVVDRLNITRPEDGNAIFQSISLRPFFYFKDVSICAPHP
jgi:hypothetical protein